MRIKLRHIWIAAAALALGACSQEATDGETGGRMPVELTASGLQSLGSPVSRATGDGNWDGVKSVVVQIGTEKKIYKVTATNDGKTEAKLTYDKDKEAEPFYWPSTGGATVEAWWPYDTDMSKPKPKVVVTENQSEYEYYAYSDFIEATGTNMSADNKALEFTHRTAKICVTLKDAESKALTGATVALDINDETVVRACYNPENTGDYLALVVPTFPDEEDRLKVTITTSDGKKYGYTHPEVCFFKANNQYSFTLKLENGNIVTLEGCTIAKWDDKPLVEDGIAEEDKGYTTEDNGNTYHVTTANGLKAWAKAAADDPTLGCVLEADIELPTLAAGETSNWTPVGSSTKPYVGTFDGNGKTIRRLWVNEKSDYLGLFGYIGTGGTVKNLTLDNAYVDGTEYVGGVAGQNSGTISHCYMTNSQVAGSDGYVGGIAGWLRDGTIEFCGVSGGKMYADDKSMNVGGIAGVINNGTVVGCYAVSSLEYNVTNVAGIGGNVAGSTLTACYADCTISGDEYVGGICGFADYTSFSKCYWKAEGATAGVGSGSIDGITKATSWTVDIMSDMNKALGESTVYRFIKNPDTSSSVPYIHEATGIGK